MNNTSITIIKQVMGGNNEKKTLKEALPVKDWQLNENLRELSYAGYVVLNDGNVNLAETTKGVLLKAISQNFDITKILKGANEIIFSHLTRPQTVFSLEQSTGLSRTTIYTAISDLESIGAIKKDGDAIRINESHEKLKLFAEILKTEIDNRYEPNAEIIFKDESRVLKKIPKGKVTDGEMTGFSLYSDYGVEYHTTHDYYIQQDKNLRLEDVLIHSVYSAYREENKAQMVMNIIFYLKNREKMDTLELRKTASEFKIASVWIDVEGYVRNNKLKNKHLFLPKEEFVEKANLYDVATDAYTLPEGFPKLFEDVGKELPQKITAYLIGGENMRIKGLKPRTKDCDIVVEDRDDYDTLMGTLTAMGYKPKSRMEFSKEDLRTYPSIILIHPDRSRIDLYTKKILRTLSLSEKMITRANYEDFQNLKIGILRNEDVFLLKSVTSREGDIQDMAILAQKGIQGNNKYRQKTFDWNIVWGEIIQQEQESHLQNFTLIIRDNLELLVEQTDIIPPFRSKLHRHVTDYEITRLLREGSLLLKDLVGYLEDDKTSGQFIRNRVDSLVNSGTVKKRMDGNEVTVQLSNEISFPKQSLKINAENIEMYLRWRFPMRKGVTPRTYEGLAEELVHIGLCSISEVDKIVMRTSDGLKEYEKIYHKNNIFRDIGALRVCIGLSIERLGKDGSTDFYVSNHEKFRSFVRS